MEQLVLVSECNKGETKLEALHLVIPFQHESWKINEG